MTTAIAAANSYDDICLWINQKCGLQTLSDYVNLSLAVVHAGQGGTPVQDLIDHVSIMAEWLPAEDQAIFSIGILDRYRDGIRSIEF
jgi:hypothetical protein